MTTGVTFRPAATPEGLRLARRARSLHDRIRRHESRADELRAERAAALLAANREGVSYTRLAEIVGMDDSAIGAGIREAKAANGT